MISGYLVGDRELVARLGRVGPAILDATEKKMYQLGVMLQRTSVKNYLSGPRPQHLGRVTGRLASSITQGGSDSRSRLERSGDSVIVYVGTNVPYGKIWEQTGIAAHTVTAKGKALKFTIGGTTYFRKSVRIPSIAPRPFLAPALADIKPTVIRELQAAVTAAAKQAMG